MVQWLVQLGVDKDKADSNGMTPLCAATCEGHLEVVQYLLEVGADMRPQKNGMGPLHFAAKQGYASIVVCLLSHRSPLNVRDKKGKLPIDYASTKIKQLIRDEEARLTR